MQFRIFSVLIISASLGLLGCSSEIDDKTAADVADAAELKLDTSGLTEVGIDQAASSLDFIGAKVTGDHTGGFNDFAATLFTDKDGKPAAFKITIQTASIFTDTEKLTGHLKSPDFFDVAKMPTATFASQKIENTGGDNYTVTGNLNLHGVTKEISFPVNIKTENGKQVATSEFTLKRFDFGIVYPGKPDDLIKDNVLVKFKVVTK